MPDVSVEQFLQAQAESAAYLGRQSGPELIFSTNVTLGTANQIVQLPRTLNVNRPLANIVLDLQFRLTQTVADFVSVAPEAFQNLIQNIQVQGIHKDLGSVTPISISGASAFSLPTIFQARGNGTQIVNGIYTPFTAGRPMVSPFLGTVAGSPYDVRMIWNIPTYPLMGVGPTLKRMGTNFMWTSDDWGDSLQLQIRFGDSSALGDQTGVTTAYTAFGSAAGSPLLNVHLNYSSLGKFRGLQKNGICFRNETPAAQQQTAITSGAVLQTLQKDITTNIIIKTGIQQTPITGGVNTFTSLSDVQLDRTQVVVDNKPVRNITSNLAQKAMLEAYFNSLLPQGYQVLSFVDGQSPLLAYRGDQLDGGSTFQVVTDVLTAAAANQQLIIQEIIRGGPFPKSRV